MTAQGEQRALRSTGALGRSASLALTAAALLGLGWSFFLKPDPDVETGNRLVKNGKAEEALAAYTQAEKRLGRRPQLDYNRGLALFGLGKYDEARDAFLAASGATEETLRKSALFNLANSLFKKAEPTLDAALKATQAAQEAETQLAALGPEVEKKARCMAMQQVMEVLKKAAEAQRAVDTAFDTARKEYRRVLEASPGFFDAKWNLEMTLRHQGAAKAAATQLDERAKALAERFKKECQDEDQKDKKDQQDKQDQKDKQDKQDKQDQQDKQDKQDQKDKQDKQDQKPMTKEDIAREKAERELEKLERNQRERDKQRSRSGARQQPVKDW